MAQNGRNSNGTFAKGHKFATGRKGYGFEANLSDVFGDVFDEPTVRAACQQLKAHIFGQKVNVKTGAIEDDPLSSPQSRIAAWTKMADYTFGKPVQPVLVDDADGDLKAYFRNMPVKDRQMIVEHAEELVEKFKTAELESQTKPNDEQHS